MQKILELNEKAFLTGVALSTGSFLSSGLFYKAKGITAFANYFPENTDVGLLQPSTGVLLTDTTSNVVGSMVERVTGAGTAKVYANDMGGKIYSINPASFAKTVLRDTTSITAAVGASIYNGNYLYSQTTQIGSFDFSTTWTDNYKTGLQNYTNHQQYEFAGIIWIADKDRISKLNGATLTTGALSLPSDYRVTCLSDDGRYLVAGITQNLGDNLYYGKTKVIFWDMTSASWVKEWPIADTNIISLTKDEISNVAFCGRGMYRFSFDSPPEKLYSFTSYEAPVYGYPHTSASLYGQMALWGSNDGTYGEVWSYGLPFGGYGKPVFCSRYGLPGVIYSIFSNPKIDQIYVGSGSNICLISPIFSGGSNVSAQTIFFDLGQKYIIEKIVVTFGRELASGDSLNIDVACNPDAGTGTTSDWGTISYAKHGAVQEVSLSGLYKTKLLSLILNFYGGTKIKRIQVFGEPDASY